ncbi:MAG: hypothetical protein ACXWXH_03395 [Aeromicrobium sp.]
MRMLRAAVVLALVLAAGGCSNDEKASGVPVPKGFEVPAGVSLTKGGTTLAKGKSATVIYQVADKTRSVVSVAVTAVKKGEIKDFRFFSLDDETKQATPFYVAATVRNIGPAGIGGAPIPLYAHDSNNTISRPNELVGDFAPCPNGTLPKKFLPDATAKVCLVYMIPKGASLVSIDLKTADQKDAITWKQ